MPCSVTGGSEVFTMDQEVKSDNSTKMHFSAILHMTVRHAQKNVVW